MPKILFDKKIKRDIIHHARQRSTESVCRFDIEIHHFIYFPTPLYTKTRCQAGFCVCWGFFYLFETIGRRGVSQSKCPEGGTRLPSGSWAGDGMPRITCGGIPRWPDSTLYQKIPPPMNRWDEGKAKGWQCYRMRTRMTAGMAASFSASLPSTAPVASSMV